jgi:tetratricopeptide (TPR) repeat protein
MPLFGARRVYDRRRVLEEAARASSRNKRRRAIAFYRWVLAVEPNNPDLHTRLAPLLADTGQHFDAWRCFRTMARAALREGRKDKALAIYRDATNRLPHELQAWEGLAHLLAKEGDQAEAIGILIEGSRSFGKRAHRPEAIHLLRRARSIDPWHLEAVFELARQLARADQRDEARLLFDGLAQRTHGERLRRVRAAQLRLDCSIASAWRWIRCVLRPGEEPAPPAEAGGVVPLRSRSRR